MKRWMLPLSVMALCVSVCACCAETKKPATQPGDRRPEQDPSGKGRTEGKRPQGTKLPTRTAIGPVIVRVKVLGYAEAKGEAKEQMPKELDVRFQVVRVLQGIILGKVVTVSITLPHGERQGKEQYRIGREVILHLHRVPGPNGQPRYLPLGSVFDNPPKHRLDDLEKEIRSPLSKERSAGWLEMDLGEKPWGTAVDGVQCRLRVDKLVWAPDETLELKADIRNHGPHYLKVSRSINSFEVEIDNRWYRPNRMSLVFPSAFGAGKEYRNIRISMKGFWTPANGSKRGSGRVKLNSSEGWRKIRLGLVIPGFRDMETLQPVRVVSNMIEVEIRTRSDQHSKRPVTTQLAVDDAQSAAAQRAPVRSQPAPDVDPDAWAILERLEEAGEKYATLRAELDYQVDSRMTGEKEARTGEVAYQRKTEKQPAKYRVLFETLRLDEGPRMKRKVDYIFDGRFVIRDNYKIKTRTKGEVSPQARKNALQIGKGPFPVPFGQKAEEVIQYLQPTTRKPDEKDPANTDYLKLVPRKGHKKDVNFVLLEMWVDRKTNLPIKIKSRDNSKNITTVIFKNIQTQSKIDPKIFNKDKPAGFELIVEPLK